MGKIKSVEEIGNPFSCSGTLQILKLDRPTIAKRGVRYIPKIMENRKDPDEMAHNDVVSCRPTLFAKSYVTTCTV